MQTYNNIKKDPAKRMQQTEKKGVLSAMHSSSPSCGNETGKLGLGRLLKTGLMMKWN